MSLRTLVGGGGELPSIKKDHTDIGKQIFPVDKIKES